jgi:integrase
LQVLLFDAKRWTGANPVSGVKTRAVSKRAYHLLRADEVTDVPDAAGDTWRDPRATGIYLGLRKGELFSLRTQDVDLADREITISRLHAAETTKGKKAVVLPIPNPLQAFLEHAVQSAPGPLVFPGTDGTQRPEGTGLEKVWRRILVRARVVVGYRYTCRRCEARKQAATHEFPDGEQRGCPTCEMRMWPSAISRPMRFHDVRHTTATLLLRRACRIQHVQRILRHANVRTTVDTYGHLTNEDLRARLELLPKPSERVLPPRTVLRHVPDMCQAVEIGKNEAPGRDVKSADTGRLGLERNTGFEPATFALARRRSTS